MGVVEGFGQEIGRAQCVSLLASIIHSGQNDGNVTQFGVLFEEGENRPTVHHGHKNIEDDDVGLVLASEVERLLAIGGRLDAIPFGGEVMGEKVANHRLIVYD